VGAWVDQGRCRLDRPNVRSHRQSQLSSQLLAFIAALVHAAEQRSIFDEITDGDSQRVGDVEQALIEQAPSTVFDVDQHIARHP
jgi:hypothetical protein